MNCGSEKLQINKIGRKSYYKTNRLKLKRQNDGFGDIKEVMHFIRT